MRWNVSCFLLLSLSSQKVCVAFLESRITSDKTIGRVRRSLDPSTGFILNSSTDNDLLEERTEIPIPSQLLRDEIKTLCKQGKILEAANVLEQAELSMAEKESNSWPEESCYLTILKALTWESNSQSTMMAENIIDRMIDNSKNGKCEPPSAQAYNAAICVWAESNRQNAASRCCEYLDMLWSLYDQTKDEKFVPLRSSYISTIDALSRSRKGLEGAMEAERLLEDMERFSQIHPSLAPNTISFNAVLNTWSKSGVVRGAATRCEEILKRMISLYENGSRTIVPDTTSFNTVIHTLAKSREQNSENRAEALLELMNEMSTSNDALRDICKPDQVSFNTVLDCWAQSRSRGGARRATSILQHMEQRYAANKTNLHPDITSYTTVINAWARSREKDAISQAEEVLRRSEEAHKNGIPGTTPNTLTYNSLINCYSKSNQPNASSRAIDLLRLMKEKSAKKAYRHCHPDVVTYTSVIDTLAKEGTFEASKMAEALLEELELSYDETSDPRLKPNIRTYTSVINAVARSRVNPQRAEVILDRIQTSFEAGKRGPKPDVVSYNALINAYGWSNEKVKAVKCFEILERMIELFNSGKNTSAKPDIITCNSVLNACAFSKADSNLGKAELMEIVIKTFEIFQSSSPSYGYPDHSTYAQVLSAISKHMPEGDSRFDMAESTFWQVRHYTFSILHSFVINHSLMLSSFSTPSSAARTVM